MIKSVSIENFKNIHEQTYVFTDFDLLVGRNNCGKSTILQALAIWQYCVDELNRNQREGNKGIQIVLPNFTALPVPEFNLLWKDKTERRYPKDKTGKKQEYIYIKITVNWSSSSGEDETFGILIRYQSQQSVYAIPIGGWKRFKELFKQKKMPRIVYVPPFSGLEPSEEWRDDSIVRKQVGKAQPGSILRNLLYRVVDKEIPLKKNEDWCEIQRIIRDLFSIEIQAPKYKKGIDTSITCTYEQRNKEYDIIAGGSGFHQTLTLLAFLYGYSDLSAILFDEPDAHMHTNLQREMIGYLRKKALERNIQFITATHSEELITSVDTDRIISVLHTVPQRTETTSKILSALSIVGNQEITRTIESPFVLYLEGQSDERILNAWANTLNKSTLLRKFFIKNMNGGDKTTMKAFADRHFDGLKVIVPNVKRIMVFDYDSKESYHPEPNNPVLFEWKRRNIENYLLVEDTWIRSVGADNLFSSMVSDFFERENLILPPKTNWTDLNANVFKIVDGKSLLFESEDSLFQQLKKATSISFNRELIASNMNKEEIHQDVLHFFKRLEQVTADDNSLVGCQ